MRPTLSFAFLQMILFFAVFNCRGQSYYFKHYQADDGLAHNSVASIIQDKKGMIWIGTRAGLNRFDGYTFKTYKNGNNKFGNIGNNVINTLIEDKNGMLWVGTGWGIFKYDPYKEAFTPLDAAPQIYINHIVADDQNNLYFLAERKLYKYIQKENRVVDLKIRASCLAFDSDMNLLMGTDDGFIRTYNLQRKSSTSVRVISPHVPPNLRSISKILPAKNNELLIGCFKQGLKSYNTKTGLIRSLPLRNSNNTDIYVRDITAASDREYWVATESGIYIYDLVTNTSRNLRKQAGDPYSIADNAVYTICRDNQGGMWAGTFFGGLNYYSKENARFEKYYPLQGSNSISGTAVREICSDNKGNLWIGTEDAGINKLHLKTGKFTHYSSTGKKGDVSYPNIHGLLALDDQLFIGPFLHGMEIMDINSGLIKERFKLIGGKGDQVSDFVLCVYLTKDSTLLIGTAYSGSGLFKYDRKRKTFTRIPQIPYNSYVFDIKEDEKGNIWTGSVAQGAFYYNPKTGKSGNIRFEDKIKGKTVNEFPVYGILEDSDHSMWFTTEGGGMIRLSPDRKTFKKFTTENGLPSNVLFRMLEDDDKRLWISSLKGLICFDMRTEQFKIYTQSNGLITDQFNFNSAYKDRNGKMYFGSVKGMIAFDPKTFEQKNAGPSTYITGFQINNKEIGPGMDNSPLSKSILHTDTIVLRHDQNNFSIEFAALNYSSPEVTRYTYLMEGLDKNRTYLSSNRKAYFTDLSAGDYTFIVQAKSNIGRWTGKERLLFIKILPPFWKSYPAYFCYLLVFAISLFWSVRYYHRYLERRNQNKLQLFEHEKEKEIYQAKIEFFTNIAHEIQTPLTLILGPVERMIKKVAEQEGLKKSLLMVEKNAKRLAELTSQLLDFRKTEMNQFGLNFVNTDINHLLNEQISAFRQEAEKNNISLGMELPRNHITVFADREALVKICSNLISNAIKYAASTVMVGLAAVQPDDEQFTIRFSNDGRGIPEEFRDKIFEPFFRLYSKDKPGTGIGLSLAKSLTELHNGSLKLVSGNTNMIVFELTLPIHQKFEFKLSSWKKIK
ncbi:signal transduction histidine kinase/ligand-binding sensor domain-containing protein [Pedobacter africanus]|uniref:Signal transduction histidine kinase/ligand-binding sensor domain-containing protein n=2 Tax=Pedobacter africanus TaxID=151894 RepID=A0ACC6KZI4_9SPHI|nr:two-component regulator propeller domain-containing protein [Pedobacter africanus]MDR6784669.1 signal transduction histidine kinase/ligand-binding sensor domain-containing protein [Pedobacter africanus]